MMHRSLGAQHPRPLLLFPFKQKTKKTEQPALSRDVLRLLAGRDHLRGRGRPLRRRRRGRRRRRRPALPLRRARGARRRRREGRPPFDLVGLFFLCCRCCRRRCCPGPRQDRGRHPGLGGGLPRRPVPFGRVRSLRVRILVSFSRRKKKREERKEKREVVLLLNLQLSLFPPSPSTKRINRTATPPTRA